MMMQDQNSMASIWPSFALAPKDGKTTHAGKVQRIPW